MMEVNMYDGRVGTTSSQESAPIRCAQCNNCLMCYLAKVDFWGPPRFGGPTYGLSLAPGLRLPPLRFG